MAEPTVDEVRAAVLALPRADLEELARGPLDDPEDCRICELYDDYVFGYTGAGEQSRVDAALLLIDWHRFYGSPTRDGRGQEAYHRCQVIYGLAREALTAGGTGRRTDGSGNGRRALHGGFARAVAALLKSRRPTHNARPAGGQ